MCKLSNIITAPIKIRRVKKFIPGQRDFISGRPPIDLKGMRYV